MSSPLLYIAGGGTGGHVMPALALADAARHEWPELNVKFIGAERGLEARLLPERNEDVLLLTMHSIQGANLAQKIRVLCWELPKAVLRICQHWQGAKPDLVVGVGGYASVSGVLAALIKRIPVVLYEQNAIPGLVNRQLIRFCQRIMLGFKDVSGILPEHKACLTGNIIRDNISLLQRQEHNPPHLLVTGGSQGARFLNEIVPAACQTLQQRGKSFAVTHIAGTAKGAVKNVKKLYEDANIKANVLAFCEDMPAFYASGDMMIARSGAMSVGEASSCGMPSVFVPLPHAADQHQLFNARALADQDAAIIAIQAETSSESLADLLEKNLFDAKHLQQMSQAALSVAPTRAKHRQLRVLAEFLPVKSMKAEIAS
ncbi:MAG: undecaprenyldiphospho-muramoylpentapeptide beta-N-acetylglucosaminyltransferase [Mariprofundaceae bacterium]